MYLHVKWEEKKAQAQIKGSWGKRRLPVLYQGQLFSLSGEYFDCVCEIHGPILSGLCEQNTVTLM